MQKFEEETGIPTEFVRMSSGETIGRLKAEKIIWLLLFGMVGQLME